ncbi:uncharacterized protein LOC118886105 [Balaenoptera musculus]|uniref:Uncharacterized protein LOC118886105 n=1 Tax=Balaenoptera musculus TaxID=9771 RepID=A0A8B8W2A6_BALMU|nr:uncharacterized protein LOC118886105 [Balaenoptera musculus]
MPREGAFPVESRRGRKKKGCLSPTHPRHNSRVQTRWGKGKRAMRALTSSGPPHLKMLLKTNWQNLGHGAVGGVWSPPVTGAAGQWLPGLSKGEEEKGEGGGWAQQESLRGRRKLAGRRKNSGRGRRLQGPREPQWRNRAQRRLRKRLSPAEGSWRQNSAQGHLTPSALCTPPRSAAVHRSAGIRSAGRRALRASLTAATGR